MNLMSKIKYTIHIHPVPFIYDDIEADDPEQAEQIVMDYEFNGEYGNVSGVEVYITCMSCGNNNDPYSPYCEYCDEKF